MGKKRIFDIDLLDTKANLNVEGHSFVGSGIIHKGTATGSYPKQALKNFSKTLPKSVNVGELRDSEHSRYIFMWKERK